jgi:outer membrane autotransporter protein
MTALMTHGFLAGATRHHRSAIFLMAATLGITGAASGAFAFGSKTSTYTVTVDDTETVSGQTWTVPRPGLWVGNAGTGSLTISNGGKVTGHEVGYLAVNSDANGTVTVTGAGSEWSNSNTLIVGYGGTGTLAVSNGGKVSSGSGSVGAYVGATGTATVDGSGSTWTSSGSLTVGNAGTGSLTVSNGGKVSNTNGAVGDLDGSNGTVTVAGSGSTWANSGSLTVGGSGTGTLAISNGGKVTSTGGAVGDRADSNGTVTVSGSGSSWTNSGSLAVGSLGAGTLTISNGGSVSSAGGGIGVVDGSNGTVSVDGAGSTWTSSGGLEIGSYGTGTLTISNGGTVSIVANTASAGGGTVVSAGVSGVTIASQEGSTGTLNIGGAAGATPTAAGKLNAATVTFGSGTGTINFNHTDASYEFASAISGNGTINQIAGNTSLTGDSSGFTGATNITGGRLAVNGSLNHSAVTGASGGILGGAGTVASIVANGGGIVAPGNSIGTLNVVGNVSFNSGSTYQVQVQADGASDRIIATGTATMTGATLKIEALTGNYRPTTTYTVLSARTVTGAFSTVTNDLAFLDASLSYDPKNIYLRLTRNDVTIGSVARTPNQRALGSVIKAGRTPDNIYNGILSQTADGARHALDQLSGEGHAAAKTALIEDSRFVRDAVNDRLRAAFGDVGAPSTPVVSYGTDGKDIDLATTAMTAAWGQAFGGWSSYDSDVNASHMKQSTGGFVTGIDTGDIENWRVGLVGGYSRSSFNMRDSASSGESDNYHLGVYGGTSWGALALRSGLAYTWSKLDTSRTVAFSGFRDGLTANYDAGALQAFGELGYRLDTEAASFEPFVNLAHVSLHTDGFTEKGGAAALSGGSQTTDTTFTTLGLRASTDFMLGSVRAAANGTVGWRHAFGDTTPYSTQGFSGSSPFMIAGVPIANDTLVLQTGVDMKVTDNATIGISYNGEIGSGSLTNRVDARLGVRF